MTSSSSGTLSRRSACAKTSRSWSVVTAMTLRPGTTRSEAASTRVPYAILSAVDPHTHGAGLPLLDKLERPTGRTSLASRGRSARLCLGRRWSGWQPSPKPERPRRRPAPETPVPLRTRCHKVPGVKKRDRQDETQPDRLGSATALLCLPCLMLGTIRRAWTVSEGRACCVRHAVEDSSLDDMDQHDLFVVIYEALRQQGYPDAH
jgi:hypothetical protein